MPNTQFRELDFIEEEDLYVECCEDLKDSGAPCATWRIVHRTYDEHNNKRQQHSLTTVVNNSRHHRPAR